MSGNNFNDIENEIAEMQKAEDKLECVLAVQQIINTHNTLKIFIAHLPNDIKSVMSENHLLGEFYFFENCLKLADFVINISAGKFLTVTRNSVIIFEFTNGNIQGERSIILELSKKIKIFASKFQEEMKEKIAHAKRKLTEHLKSF